MELTAFQAVTIGLIAILSVIGVGLFIRTVGHLYRVIRLGLPDHTRGGMVKERTFSLLAETLGHARLGQWRLIGVLHWFVFAGFAVLFFTLINAYGQLFDPEWVLPVIGHWVVWEWASELFAWATLVAILWLIVIRQRNHPRSAPGEGGRRSRFFGSSFWQAYYVEATILAVAVCIIFLRGHEWALAMSRYEAGEGPEPTWVHFPLSGWMGHIVQNESVETMETAVVVIAAIKIIVSMAWFMTISLQPSMGVAWHRFLAFFNVWFKRHPGRAPERNLTPSLGELQPIRVNGEPLDFEKLDEMPEDAPLGVGAIEHFSWKGLLDFSTCTECGRCQSQCPAWNTDKPLSPKLVILSLRDHNHAKAPWLLASEAERAAVGSTGGLTLRDKAEAERPLVGAAVPGTRSAGGATNSSAERRDILADLEAGLGGVIDPDVLWSCTTCGACVQQCPVDIEHVDHIVDMRRYQVLIEHAFPSELSGLYKKLEKNSNPWGVSPRLRMDWAKGLPFDVPQVGADVEDLTEVEYLFWVGCAGAYEDRQKKTTRAIAELLHMAGVTFAVLGDGEACTGDPARRSGNEFLFHMLAQQNVEMLNEVKAKKIVVSCAHCFNTLRNEYPQLGGHYEVVHHTQLLNRLVRERRLLPVAPIAGPTAGSTASNGAVGATTVTYHDPCYIGRHNGVYAPPRELISAMPGVQLAEMPRHAEQSFCCGAGGSRMWMEEQIGTRINGNRTAEAVATGASKIAVACPFCRVMLSDGLTAAQAEDKAPATVEVIDVAQMLLAAVRRPAPPAVPSQAATPEPKPA